MECSTAQDLIVAWIDRQLDSDEAASLEPHVSVCAECRAMVEELRIQDADLLRAFQPRRDAARRVAERAIVALNNDAVVAPSSKLRFGIKWISLTAAAAAGFLIATLLYQPWEQDEAMPRQTIATLEKAPVDSTVATLVVATGDVEVRAKDVEQWLVVTDQPGFVCPTDSAIKTGPNVRCELITSNGCIIRLNDETEVTVNSGNAVEVQRGEIWCSSPENVSLAVTAPQSCDGAGPLSRFSCSANSSALAEVRRDRSVQVTTASGEVELWTQNTDQRLRHGESATIECGDIILSAQSTDPILAANWIHSLLIRKGLEDAELASRVDELLARIGRSKVSLLYEQEIRSLGEYAVLPLLRFVRSPISEDDPAQRQTAMRILADMAPSWSVSELINLLADRDPDTRALAAKALERLTGINHGREVEQWREVLMDCESTIRRWQQWWAENQDSYPPPVSASKSPTT